MFTNRSILNKPKVNKILIYSMIIGLFWLKMSYIQGRLFNLNVVNLNEASILAFNPLSSIFLIFGIGILLAGRYGLLVSYILGTLVLYVNVLFYREYNDFITIPTLSQAANLAGLGGSIGTIVNISDLLIFVDIFIALCLLFYMKRDRLRRFVPKRREGIIMAVIAIPLFIVNIQWAETERTDLLERTFDRNMLVKYIGLINYHIYDAVLQGKTEMKKTLADSNELVPVINYLNEEKTKDSNRLEGVADGKNIIAISLESTQTFVVDNKLHGEELTPYFNNLKEEGIYFNNFYHQVKQGRTSDSEFLLANSLYPLNRGAVFFTNSSNEYQSMPKLLNKQGYFTNVMHANDRSFWNRNVMYDALGIDRFFSKKDYLVTEEKSHGWGYLDEYFFADSLKKMGDMDQPFYSKLITLTNHYPFSLPEDKKLIEEGETSSGTLNRYFQTIRYQDEALKQFVEEFKKSDLYDNTILMIYGDHFGISENHQRAMGEYLGKEINEYEQFQLQRVPLLLYGKGIHAEKNNTVGGQIDLRPTLTNLLGVEDPNPVQFGQDLLNKERRELMITRDGDFASEQYVGIQEACYDRDTGENVDFEACSQGFEKAKEELTISDSVIYGDLLRYLDETKLIESRNEVDPGESTQQ